MEPMLKKKNTMEPGHQGAKLKLSERAVVAAFFNLAPVGLLASRLSGRGARSETNRQQCLSLIVIATCYATPKRWRYIRTRFFT